MLNSLPATARQCLLEAAKLAGPAFRKKGLLPAQVGSAPGSHFCPAYHPKVLHALSCLADSARLDYKADVCAAKLYTLTSLALGTLWRPCCREQAVAGRPWRRLPPVA